MRGSHVIAEAATRAGCRFYAGYPITPQNELPEYMSERFADIEDATFIQAESELAAINMVMGASMAGVRAMTSSSSPGISLKQEGISYMAGMELPAVVVGYLRRAQQAAAPLRGPLGLQPRRGAPWEALCALDVHACAGEGAHAAGAGDRQPGGGVRLCV